MGNNVDQNMSVNSVTYSEDDFVELKKRLQVNSMINLEFGLAFLSVKI